MRGELYKYPIGIELAILVLRQMRCFFSFSHSFSRKQVPRVLRMFG